MKDEKCTKCKRIQVTAYCCSQANSDSRLNNMQIFHLFHIAVTPVILKSTTLHKLHDNKTKHPLGTSEEKKNHRTEK